MASVLLTMVAAFNEVRVGLWVLMRENEIITGTGQVIHQVTSDLTPLSCVQRCSSFAWCLAVVTNYPVGKCELLEKNVTLLDFSSSLPDTGFLHWERENNDNFLSCPRFERSRTISKGSVQGHTLSAVCTDERKESAGADRQLIRYRCKNEIEDWSDVPSPNWLEDWCPVDDGFVLSPAAQFCFLVVDNVQNNWTDNKRECEKQGLTLVVPDTTLKMNILLNAIWTTPGRDSKVFHIGASRPIRDLSGRWTGDNAMFDWITGSRIDKEFLKPFWAPNQPNNDYNSQHCLAVAGNLNHMLNDKECFEDNYFICEKRRQ